METNTNASARIGTMVSVNGTWLKIQDRAAITVGDGYSWRRIYGIWEAVAVDNASFNYCHPGQAGYKGR